MSAGEVPAGDASGGHAEQEVRARHREAGGDEPEGQVEDEGCEAQPALHDEAGGGAAA
jgi:hypothetical protein